MKPGPYEVVPNWLKPLPTHDDEWGFWHHLRRVC